MIFKIAVSAYTKANPDAANKWNRLRDTFLDAENNAYNYNTETTFTVSPKTVGSDVYMVVEPDVDQGDALYLFCSLIGEADNFENLGDYITVDEQPLRDFIEADGSVEIEDFDHLFSDVDPLDLSDYDIECLDCADVDPGDDLLDADFEDLEDTTDVHPLDVEDFNEGYDSIFDDDFDDLESTDEEPADFDWAAADTIYFDEDDVPMEDDYSWESDLYESCKAIDNAFKGKKKGCCGGGTRHKARRSKRLNESIEIKQHEYFIPFNWLGYYIFGLGAQNVDPLLIDAFTYDAADVEANYNDYCGYAASIETVDGEKQLVIREVDGIGSLTTFAYVFCECITDLKAKAPGIFRKSMGGNLEGILDNVLVSDAGDVPYEFIQALAYEDMSAYEEMAEMKYVSPSKQRWISVNESRKQARRSGRLVPLTEALKAQDPKDQKKLDKAVKTIEDVIKAVKGQTIGEAEARDAMKKLKAQQNALKKIKKDDERSYNLTDVKGTAAIIKKIIAADPTNAEQIKKFNKSLTESVVIAIGNRQRSLHTNVSIDHVPVPRIATKALMEAYKMAKESKVKYINALRESVVGSERYEKLKNGIANKSNMMAMIVEELSYRRLAAKVLKQLNEDENKDGTDTSEPETGSVESMDDLAAMFGTTPEDAPTEGDDTANEEDGTEEVELARVVIQMADKESAEQLRDLCKDAGIPDDAMEIEDGTEESIDEPAEGDEAEDGAETEGAGEANESMRYSNIMKLFEAEDDEAADAPAEGDDDVEEPAEGDDDAEDAGDEENEDDAAVKFILTDTDYVDQLAKVLEDDYGITSDEFQEMIGGEIVSADDDIDDAEDKPAEDDDTTDSKEDDDEETEDDMTAADIFGNM